MRPSRSPPILMWCSCARPWVIAIRFSLRVSTQRTGLPVCLAAQATTICSRSTPILAPNPPPTSGATTRIASAGSPPPLHRRGRDPLVDDVALDHDLAPGEDRVVADGAAAPHAHVGARVGEQQGLIRQGRLD